LSSTTTTKKRSSSRAKDEKSPDLIEAERLAEEFAVARQHAEDLRNAADDAEIHVADIEASWKRGDADTYTESDYLSAQAKAKRDDLLAAAAEKQRNLLSSRQVNTDIRVAQLLVDAVDAALKGRVPVETRIGKAPTLESDSLGMPSVVITQASATEDHGGIFASKRVDFSFVRDPMFAPFPVEELKRAAKQLGHDIGIDAFNPGHHTRSDGSLTIDTVRAKVYGIADPEPIFADDNAASEHGRKYASQLCGQLVAATQRDDRPMGVMGETVNNSHGTVKKSNTVVTHEGAKRLVTVTAEIEVTAWKKDTFPEPIFGAVIDRQVGQVVPWLGRITEIDSAIDLASSRSYGLWNDPRIVSVTATFVSRTS
jgi:signal recognition particle subunit SEC65